MSGTEKTIQNELSCRAIFADPDAVPDLPGIYFIYLLAGEELLVRSGFGDESQRAAKTSNGDLVYIGMSNCTVRQRIKKHVYGDSRVSSVRRTVGMLLAEELSLDVMRPADVHFQFGRGEERLTDWIVNNGCVRYMLMSEPTEMEKFLIKSLRPPMNLTQRRTDEQAKKLMRAMRQFRGH